MFKTEPITGAELPDGALVLTYDDGPGPNTLPVAEYLSGMGIGCAARWGHRADSFPRAVWLVEPDRSDGPECGRHLKRRARGPYALDN